MSQLNNQVMPIHKGTFIGVATNQSTDDAIYKIVQATADGTVTVTVQGTTKAVPISKGKEISIAGATQVTSTAAIIMS